MKDKGKKDKEMSFKELMEQDKHVMPLGEYEKQVKNRKNKQQKEQAIKQAITEIHLSDEYYPNIDMNDLLHLNDIKYKKDLQNLKAKRYTIDGYIDLHGLNKSQAKETIINGIAEAKTENLKYIIISHGIGTGVLKNQVPFWLAQHPDITAFARAQQKDGGEGAIIISLKP